MADKLKAGRKDNDKTPPAVHAAEKFKIDAERAPGAECKTPGEAMMKKIKVGILGATGMVGQRFITLLADHPWFEVVAVAASSRSAEKKYSEAVEGKWKLNEQIPENIAGLIISDVADVDKMKKKVDFVFSAIEAAKEEIMEYENRYAGAGIPVVSNNSAHRWTKDVPMIIPEINPHHLGLIRIQQQNHKWDKGFVVVKPNCSLQSFLPAIAPLMKFRPKMISVTTMQAVSGAGKTLETYPEIIDNVIPNINGEEEKTEREPLKILGTIKDGEIKNIKGIKISAQCNRVSVSDGHMATVSVKFGVKPTKKEILELWNSYKPEPQRLKLPSAPDPFLVYKEDEAGPQTKLDRNNGNGMVITIGRLRECNVLDFKFVALSHNTIRGAAGGAILVAELLKAKGYLELPIHRPKKISI